MTAATNTDLPNSWKRPGVYTQINFAGAGPAADDDSRRVLLLGFKSSTGTFAVDTPVRCQSQSDCNTGAGTGSDLARIFAAYQSQNGPGLDDIWVLPLTAPSGGTAATYTMTFAGPATSAGAIDCYVCGYRASVGIANGDTATQVATALYAELAALTDLPVTWTDSGSGTLTATYRHKGLVGNDLPIRVDQTDATGITDSPGTITYTNAATGDGSTTLTVGATTVTAAISGGASANTVAQAMADAINASAACPVTAGTVGTGAFPLYYKKGRVVRRVSAAITGSTVITVAVSLHGTSGAGVPTLTTALANVEAIATGFSAWVNPFVDTSGTTTLDAIYDSVLVQENGLHQKGPEIFQGSPAALASAGAIITAPAPDLTASPRFTLAWCRESPQQGCEIAARYAGAYVAPTYYAKNLDGTALVTRGSVPLMIPDINDRPSAADINSAMLSYYMTPIVVDARDNLVIERATTTSNAVNADLHELSTMRQVDRARPSLNERLGSLFSGKSYRTSTPKTPNTVTTDSVRDAIYVWMLEQDDQDLFDDAEKWKTAIKVNVNATNNTKFDVYVPLAIIRCLHQLGVGLSPQ